MKRCFAYIRVSTVKQGDGVSLEAQTEAIQAFASRQDIQIIKWFEEKQTAAKRGRPIFNKMVSELRRGKAHGLVIHKIDRSARNLADWARICEMADTGIEIHFATESLDFGSRGGRLAANMQAVVAEDYVRNLREETIKGLNGRLKQGLYPFQAPIGYLNNGGGKPKTLDPTRAPLVKRAFQLYASRTHSLRSLLAEMQHLGLTPPKSQKLTLCGLETMLNNPFYCGIIHIKRTGMTYNGIHKRLITPALFQRVQDIKSGKSGPKVTRHNHTYRGLFRCGLCSGPMVPELQKGTVYYRCPVKSCETKTVREDQIILAIETCLERAQLTDQDAKDARTEIECWIAKKGGHEAEKALSLRMANVEDRIERLTDAMIDRLIDKDAYSQRKRKLALEEEALHQERQDMGKMATKAEHLRTVIELTKNLVSGHDLADPAEKRQMLEMTTSNRTIIRKNIYLAPQVWLQDLKKGQPVLNGAPARDRDRTSIVSSLSTVIDFLSMGTKKFIAKSNPNTKGAKY